MIGLRIRFLAGRFNGTSWYQAHNEGIPEWPPSPWRVLRALVSAAFAEGLPHESVAPLLGRLGGLPRYRLPGAVDAHTRHYMPDTDDANHKKVKVFDAFVAVEGGAQDPQALTIAWPVDLARPERELLVQLCRRITYVGRAESWAELEVVDVTGDEWDCWPDERAQLAAATSLMALQPVAELAAWADQQPKPRKGPDVPRTQWDVLTFDSERYRSEGWNAVPGTRLVRYVFKTPPFRRAVVPQAARRVEDRPTVARFAIRSAVLPRAHEAVSIGERLRQSAMSHSNRVSREGPTAVFSGHGEPGRHRHAMYLATSDVRANRERGTIDHLVIAAREGFDELDIEALQGLRRLWGRGGHDLELVLVGLGHPADFGGRDAPHTPILACSKVWESVTPFVPTRHPKEVRGAWIDTIDDQLRRGCDQLLGIRPVTIEPAGERSEWHRFRRRRFQGSGRRGPDGAYGARLTFDQPVTGPIALGYGAHFGLGLFAAV